MKLSTVRGLLIAFASLAATSAAAQDLPAPEILSIASPADGVIEITMSIPADEGRVPSAFHVYRRGGTHTTADDFDILKRGSYPHRFMDTLGTPEFTGDSATLTLIASGLQSGTFSFYVTRTNGGFGTFLEESGPSNVATVVVSGSNDADGMIGGSVTNGGTSSSPLDAITHGAGIHPNPATDALRVTHPAGIAATARIVDATGRTVATIELAGRDGASTIDIAALRAGTYQLVVVAGDRIALDRFVVVR